MDFTINKYCKLLQSLIAADYCILGVGSYLSERPANKVIVLRHDVDEQPQNALEMARVESSMGIHATYYFRRVPKSDHPEIIRQICALGHEIGYHYEDLSSAEGDMENAIESFGNNLKYFRQYYPVRTVCMHGSSSSKYDNRDVWRHIQLKDYDLIGEPYLSFDFKAIYYMTDTGYSWDGGKFAVRDKVDNPFSVSFHTTDEVISAVMQGVFPQQAMILAHTLWTDNLCLWFYLHVREFIRNRVKLLSKRSKFVATVYNKIVKAYWK